MTEALLKQFPQLRLIPQSNQVRFLHTRIRDATSSREDYVFFADRLIRLIVEEGLNCIPVADLEVNTPTQVPYNGVKSVHGICGVSIMRAGESMEQALRETCRGVRIGKILIQRDETTADKAPDTRFSYSKVPLDIHERIVFLMDPMLATGGSAAKAAEILIDKYKVKEENIIFLNVVSCPEGLTNFSSRFPKILVVTSAIDDGLNEHKYILPGLGDFGDRYFGTTH
ncbi:uracil phosphoribosyltransferase, putative [Bodo saltans]|uniref:uracil phosphoribosyltransferase n=1 Tax=Bodo saltans TaxID=75058 RepID=A0A0S4JQZ2_BODSA|nr:uracil phosphoribosyltransferase, putative [Bodo saltans]|eukprot:CUG93954.1 uracil phosphoribosyltransferase, putative [Bodo saltans]